MEVMTKGDDGGRRVRIPIRGQGMVDGPSVAKIVMKGPSPKLETAFLGSFRSRKARKYAGVVVGERREPNNEEPLKQA
ncbi:hypothetical protein Nepgr_011916 [Nepenthes gracilis]|uniref:Uncharacterized protein n=1 Tax=Nepenthes gracilis TaxID=150966 RepID=A0AAD3SFY5_NEPGR|nr:hypothetical protein Nepgr_011916 [Nepenthes gracilis]